MDVSGAVAKLEVLGGIGLLDVSGGIAELEVVSGGSVGVAAGGAICESDKGVSTLGGVLNVLCSWALADGS